MSTRDTTQRRKSISVPGITRPRAVVRFRHARLEALEGRCMLAVSLTGIPTWIDEGPGPINMGQVVAPTDNRVAGAIESLAVGASGTVFAGAVGGGVWRTSNFSADKPTWTPLNDQLPSLYCGTIGFDPKNNNVLYVGTGSFSNATTRYLNQLPQTAVGIFRATNVYATNTKDIVWEHLGATTFAEHRIRSVVPTTDQNVILVAALNNPAGVDGGVYRSADQGKTWNRITDGLPAAEASDLVADPTVSGRAYAALPGQGVYRTDDFGIHWLRIDDHNTAITGIAGSINIELAVHQVRTPPNGTVLYVAVVGAGGRLTGVFRDSAGGDTFDNDESNGPDDAREYNWHVIGTSPPAIHQGSQGFNNLAIVADPLDPNTVYVGGDRDPQIFRGNAQADTWTSIVGAGTAHGTGPHVDSRKLLFLDNTTLLESDDGGVFQMLRPQQAATSDWVNKNGTLRTVEFFSVAYDTSDNRIFGGSQDNGSSLQDATDSQLWTQALGGDGLTQAYDARGDVRYFYSNDFFFFRRSQGVGYVKPSFQPAGGGAENAGLDNTAGVSTVSDRDFATRADLAEPLLAVVTNPLVADALLVGRHALYLSSDKGDTLNTVIGPRGVANEKTVDDAFVAAVYGGRGLDAGNNPVDRPNVFYAGTFAGRLYVRDDTGTIHDRTAALAGVLPGVVLKGVVVDPQNWKHAFVLKANRVAETLDGGATWTEITGNLGGLTTELRSIALVDDVLTVGGLGGVFRRLGGKWSKFGAGLPNGLVQDLRYVDADPDNDAADGHGILLAGLFGRGAWEIPDVSATISVPGIVTIAGNYVIGLVRDAFDGLLDVTINAIPADPLDLLGISSIIVRPQGSYTTTVIDESNGPISVDSIQVICPGGYNRVVVKGAAGSDLFRFAGQGPVVNGVPILSSNIQEYQIYGNGGDDTLGGPDQNNVWSLSSLNNGVLNGSIYFFGMANLLGGSQNDRFRFNTSAGVTGTIDGGSGGLNTLDYSALASAVLVDLAANLATNTAGIAAINAVAGSGVDVTLHAPDTPNQWNLTAARAGTITDNLGQTIAFTGVNKLVGGLDDDQFNFRDAAVGFAAVDGGGGTNTLDHSAVSSLVRVSLVDNPFTSLVAWFQNIAVLVGSDAAGGILFGPNADSTWTIDGVNAGALNGMRFAKFNNLYGGTKNDLFRLYTGGSIAKVLNGQGGINVLDYSFWNAGGVRVNLLTAVAPGLVSFANVSMVVGSQGDDVLTADNAGALLMGGPGSDQLLGGNGRDVLFGGSDSDILHGGSDEDLLFGGSTTYYDEVTKALQLDALTAILQEWKRNVAYSARISNLTALPNPLISAATFKNDAVADYLYGEAGTDWFLTSTLDVLLDRAANETVSVF